MRCVCAVALACLMACTPEYGVSDVPDAHAWGEANPAELPPTEQVDHILQVVEPYVDILWVIDSSPSMVDDREALAAAFPSFVDDFEAIAVDYHIGVVSTDMETEGHQGQLQERQGVRWLENDTPDMGAVFTEMTTTGMATSSLDEKGREAAWTALELQSDFFNEGFLRDDEAAWLHITVVTDEDDDTLDTTVSVERFAEYVNFIRPYAERTSFNSVVAMVDTGKEERGESYIALSEAIGGSVFNINQSSWDTVLASLGGLQAPQPLTEVFLSQIPIPETLDVKVVDPAGVTFVYVQGVDYIWSAERNSVPFLGEPPGVGSSIQVTYTVASADPGGELIDR